MTIRPYIVGNWKMHGGRASLPEIAAVANAAAENGGVDVAICPPFTLIDAAVAQSDLSIGAQDCHSAISGAHTGCVSAVMLREAGAGFAIVGHSERRADQGETNADVRGKASALRGAGLGAILCVGETLEQRESGDAEEVVAAQLEASLPADGRGDWLSIAYEPVWAIGTGKVASPAEIAPMHARLRQVLVLRYGDEGRSIRILYGGSVKAANALEILAIPDVGGALVGGASLVAADFIPIIEAAAAIAAQKGAGQAA